MASGKHQGNESNDKNATHAIYFWKLILSDSPRDKFKLPREFVKEYGQGLSKTLFLMLPNGAEWKVKLTKRHGEFWICKGWKEFAEFHFLFKKRLLVFRYEGTSRLQVLILSMTGLEIKYPFPGKASRDGNKDQGFQVPRTEISEECSPRRKRKDNSPLSCDQKCKMRRTYGGNKVENTPTIPKAPLHPTSSECIEVSKRMPTSKFRKPEAFRRVRRARTPRKGSRASERANTFQFRKPFFQVTLKPSYVDSTKNFSLPSKFAKRYFDLNKNGEVVFLRTLNGRVWTMRHVIRKAGTITRYELSCAGWKAFVQDNSLKKGDVCIFELIDIKETTFRVFINPNTDSLNCPSSQDERKADGKGKRKMHNQGDSTADINCQRSSFSDFGFSGNPSFKKKIGLAHTLHISNLFQNTPTLQKIAMHPTSRECTAGSTRTSTSKLREPEAAWKFRQAKTIRKGSKAFERADTFQSRNPFVPVPMKPSYVSSTSWVNFSLPCQFAKRYFDSNKNGEVVFLRDLNGRVWTMKHIIRKTGTTTRYELPCAGWKAFAKDNDLKKDDVCIFELIDMINTTFRVFIYRSTETLNFVVSSAE